jgi:leucyl aminopeptidase (aminopeptidase T)
MSLKKSLLILAPLVLSGCAMLTPAPKQIEVKTVEVQRVIPLQPAPKPLKMNDITWYVVTAENYQEFKERFEKENGNFVFYAISVPDYENMALNMAELKRYILQQKQIVIYYEKAVSPEPKQEAKK